MCGIVGYIGSRSCSEILIEGLIKLEYRGYDSAGLAVFDGSKTNVVRSEGKLANLIRLTLEQPVPGSLGIGHTRWATHGKPNEKNAHPHTSGTITVVHNGIIENHLELREKLKAQGRVFKSETDTEIISHLIEMAKAEGCSLVEAVREALKQIDGSYAIAVLDSSETDKLVAARHSSPLVIGLGEGENFIASDIPAILNQTREMVFLEDGDIAVLSEASVEVSRIDGEIVERPSKRIVWSPTQAEKGGYKHFMLKEIFEQPRAITDTLRGRISLESGEVVLDDIHLDKETLEGFDRVIIVACGTSYHAGLIGKFWIEDFARIPVEVEMASEFRYRKPIVDERTLVLAISQSGETADTLAAIKDAKSHGARILSICNVLESSIPRTSDDTIYTHAGPEIGVASTKAFITQLVVLYLIAIYVARTLEKMPASESREKLQEMVKIPQLVGILLHRAPHVRSLAKRFYNHRDFLYLGRWVNYPVALEGALKLKEISYIHAEGYPGGEMKHGPIALIDEDMPVVAIVTRNRIYEKIISNMQEAQAREGVILALATDGDEEIWNHADEVLTIPEVEETLEPLLTVVPLQMLAYYVADFKGTDVDQPRNLAKSVTVE